LTERNGAEMERRIFLKLALFSPLWAAGCTVGPDYARPKVLVGDSYTQIDPDQGVKEEICADLTAWWSEFSADPVLNRLLWEAAGNSSRTGNNPTLRQVAWRIQEARATLGITRSELFPQLGADGSYLLQKLPNIDNSLEQWDLGTSMTWEIDVFGRLKRYTEAAMDDMEAEIELYRDAYILLLSDIATNYVNARAYAQQIEIARSNIKIRQNTFQLTQEMERIGKSSHLDVHQAEGSLRAIEAELPDLTASYRAVLNRLSILTGNPPGGVDDLFVSTAPIPAAPEEILVGIPAELLRRRPDIRAAEMKLMAQNARIGAAEGDLYPIFSLNGSFGLEGETFSGLWNSDSITAGITPGFRWNIFNFGRYRSNVRLQQYLFNELAESYRQTVLSAAEEVDNSLARYTSDKERTIKLNAALESYRQALVYSEERYRNGTSDFQRVLDSQREMLVYELSAVKSRAKTTIDVIDLYRALGGGWQSDPASRNPARSDDSDDPDQPAPSDEPLEAAFAQSRPGQEE